MSKKKIVSKDSSIWNSWEELAWLGFEINNSFEAMNELLKYVKKSWLISKEKLANEIKFFEEDEQSPNYHFELEERLMDEIKNRTFFAVFLSSYAIFEGSLNKICKLIENEFQFVKKMEDFNSNKFLTNNRDYLKKVYEIDVNDIQPQWSKISNYSNLRNVMSHEDGKTKKTKYKESLEQISHLKVYQNQNSISVSINNEEFFDDFFNELRDFFKKLIKLIDDKYSSWESFKKKSLVE